MGTSNVVDGSSLGIGPQAATEISRASGRPVAGAAAAE